MAINYFIGWNQGDLEEALRNAQEDLAAGKASIQAGAGDASAQHRVEKSITSRIQMIYKALNLADPVTYPIEQISAITAVKVAFS